MVEQAQVTLALAWHPPVVKRTERKHNQHAHGEECDTEGVLPTGGIAHAQNNPRNGQGEQHPSQMGEGVEYLFGRTMAQGHRRRGIGYEETGKMKSAPLIYE